MASLICGIDWSSQRIDVALIPLAPEAENPDCPPVTFRSEELPRLGAGDRVWAAFDATERLLRDVVVGNGRRARHAISTVWIEEAYGAHMNATRVLLPIFGAMWAAVPRHMGLASMSPPEWRKELGMNNAGKWDKDKSIKAAWEWLGLQVDDHQAEALLIALAGKQITWRHHEGVTA